MYSLPWCLHCGRAKALLRRRGVAFDEVDGSGVPEFRSRLAELTGGFTLPQIVIDGEPIGGAARLPALDRLGVLVAIAQGEPFPIRREIRRIPPGSLVRWAAARVRGGRDVAAVRRVQVRIDRAGRLVGTDDPKDAEAVKEGRDGEGLCRTAG